MKICSGCGEEKGFELFPRDKSKPDGRHSRCKACLKKRRKESRSNETDEQRGKRLAYSKAYRENNPEKFKAGQRNAYLKGTYGIDQEQYDQMFEAQQGCCAICGSDETQWGRLAVDHNHETGEVRGLLCFNCNTSIGKMGDSPELLRKAAEYLEESSRS